MNTEKYTTNTTASDGGIYYKNTKPFDEIADDEILYISEQALEAVIDNATIGYDFTDEELVRLGFADTKRTIREDLQAEYTMLSDETIDRHNLIRMVFDLCSWQSPSTIVASLWEDEEVMAWIHE